VIVEGLIKMFTGFVRFVLDMFPHDAPPGWLASASEALTTVWGYAAGLGAWIPWSFVGTVTAAVVASVALGFTLKLIRIVASFFTAGGGSAA
jgi:hypothetical protein